MGVEFNQRISLIALLCGFTVHNKMYVSREGDVNNINEGVIVVDVKSINDKK